MIHKFKHQSTSYLKTIDKYQIFKTTIYKIMQALLFTTSYMIISFQPNINQLSKQI